MLEETRN